MGYACPHCRRSLDEYQVMFPSTVECPGCGHEVGLPAIEISSDVVPRKSRKTARRAPTAAIVAGCAVLPVVALAIALYWFGAATRLLQPDHWLIENYLREHANDPDDFEVVEWSVPKTYIRPLNGQSATSYEITIRARNVVGALSIHRMQVSVSNGEVIESIPLD